MRTLIIQIETVDTGSNRYPGHLLREGGSDWQTVPVASGSKERLAATAQSDHVAANQLLEKLRKRAQAA